MAKAAAEHREMNEEDESEDAVIREMLKRGKQPNINFYAFTATPKYKTKHVFDEPGPDGLPPFHKYSMRQAIEERFILDVLENFTHYESYFKLLKSIEDDPNVKRKKAAKALARFVSLHAYNLQQKTEIMVEHFRTCVKHKIGGRAKAMVVTESRLHAVRYKQEFDTYIQKKGYGDVKTLVAFSGSVEYPEDSGIKYTEVGMNDGIRETELPAQFDTDEYKVLLVAEKYQTGFDQPYLHTMYVDKKLSGLQAVQTLSRLNRNCTGKEDTFVLDFRNSPEEIFKAFKPYYEQTPVDPLIDAQHLYRLQHQIEETHIVFEEEINQYCEIYYKDLRRHGVHDQAKMDGFLNLAVERVKALEEEEAQESFKSLLVNFRNMYAFMSQVIPFQDTDLEKLYTYIRFLLTKLPYRSDKTKYRFDDEVDLEFFRLQKISEGRIDLSTGKLKPLKGPSDVGTGQDDKELALSELIDVLNERFGTDFTQADQYFFDQIAQQATQDEALREAASANSVEDFRYVFSKAYEGLIIDRMDGNEEIFTKIMSDEEFRDVTIEHLLHRVYSSINSETSEDIDAEGADVMVINREKAKPLRPLKEYEIEEPKDIDELINESLIAAEPKVLSETDREVLADLLHYADSRLHPFLKYLVTFSLPLPKIGFEITNSSGTVIADAELAWEDLKLAVLTEEMEAYQLAVKKSGWRVETIDDIATSPLIFLTPLLEFRKKTPIN